MKKILSSLLKKTGLLSGAKRLLRSFNYRKSISLNQKKIITPYLFGTICKVDEPWMIEILNKILRLRSGTFIDVGVNIGQTLIQVKSIENDRKYIGFEPNPSCNFYVEQLIKANRFSDCVIIPAGLFIENNLMKLDLYHDDITNSGGSIIDNFRGFNKTNRIYQSIVVPVFKFNTVQKSIGITNFDIIKIDVEGSELEVLISLKEAIFEYSPLIILEILPSYSEENHERIRRQNLILELIDEINYDIYRIIKSDKNKLRQIITVTDFGIHSNLDWCDYILSPKHDLTFISEFEQLIN